MSTVTGLRQASRRAVQSQIVAIAEDLFVAKGFEETTVDEIAAAVGMSQRSFFRYFPSKDDVVLDRLTRLGDDLLSGLASRPLDEPEWDSLQHMFDPVLERFTDDELREHDAAMQRVIDGSARLLAAYLQRLDAVQQRLTDELQTRADSRDSGSTPDPIVLRAKVGAAFACLHAAICHVVARDDPDQFAHHLHHTMTALRPAADAS
ncbi:TetR family transcriptional regulator [Glycomyces buryatensis]|uniref:TetR family transcriptional regulator n=1 Tax=Glycomyces buryatensis TaxID=2570927 RepID=A0A4S8QP67_9ACTN|nr:TetR family transcriptional regulator [Glycomyces buryatensis]THV42504.1 TetR family transcriptional regulator [Glycomyces buryatensis]